MEFMHEGLPQMELHAKFTPPKNTEPTLKASVDIEDTLTKIIVVAEYMQ